jgi:DNA-binding transcriptional ArsR family regulator
VTSTRTNTVEADIACVAAAIGSRARARVLLILAGVAAMPAGELASEAGLHASTVSKHLTKLLGAKLVTVERDGSQRIYRLANPDVVRVLEQLSLLARPVPMQTPRSSTRAEALRRARMCYDHLAGRLGVTLMTALLEQGMLIADSATLPDTPSARILSEAGVAAEYAVSAAGIERFAVFGVTVPEGRHTVCYCVDWVERRPHLAGALGGALAARLFELGWVRRGSTPRVVHVTDSGSTGLLDTFGIDPDR